MVAMLFVGTYRVSLVLYAVCVSYINSFLEPDWLKLRDCARQETEQHNLPRYVDLR